MRESVMVRVIVVGALWGCGGSTLDAGTNERGGVVYLSEGKTDPLDGAIVTMRDSTNALYRVRSDATGRFDMPPRRDWSPTYPMLVSVAYGDEMRTMKSPIYGDTPCSSCHERGIFLRAP